MDQRNQYIYKKLLADSRFVQWASGRNKTDDVYWEQWQKNHSDSLDQFSEACRTVQMLRFKSPEIASNEISERWLQSKKKMKLRLISQSSSDVIFWYRRIAGILILPLLMLALWFLYSQHQLRSDFNRINEYSQRKTIRVAAPLGGQLCIDLPDGSKTWLNSGSELIYPAYFAQGKREVEMTGEVYFQVFKSDKLFVVKNPGPTIKVYGTEFNVHAYPDEKEIAIALAKGRIALDNNGRERVMEPGEIAIFDKTSGHIQKQEADIYPYTCWREGKYIFRNAPLGTILKTLERRYHVIIDMDDPDLSQFKYNATFNGEPLEQILELMTFTAPINYTYKKPQMNPDGSYSQAEVKLWRDASKMLNQKN